MAFNYNPKDASSAWPAGDYDIVVAAMEQQVSKNTSKEMLKLTLKVFNNEGRELTMFEYIVNPDGIFKLKQIAQAFGQLSEFNAGKFDPYSIIDKRMSATLAVKDDPEFGEKNIVKKFFGAKGGSTAPNRKASPVATTNGESVFKDSDIPF